MIWPSNTVISSNLVWVLPLTCTKTFWLFTFLRLNFAYGEEDMVHKVKKRTHLMTSWGETRVGLLCSMIVTHSNKCRWTLFGMLSFAVTSIWELGGLLLWQTDRSANLALKQKVHSLFNCYVFSSTSSPKFVSIFIPNTVLVTEIKILRKIGSFRKTHI